MCDDIKLYPPNIGYYYIALERYSAVNCRKCNYQAETTLNSVFSKFLRNFFHKASVVLLLSRTCLTPRKKQIICYVHLGINWNVL